jgi:hypothetical protein
MTAARNGRPATDRDTAGDVVIIQPEIDVK